MTDGGQAVLGDEGLDQCRQEGAEHQVLAHLDQLGSAVAEHGRQSAVAVGVVMTVVVMMMVVTVVMTVVMAVVMNVVVGVFMRMAKGMVMSMIVIVIVVIVIVIMNVHGMAQRVALQEPCEEKSHDKCHAEGKSHARIRHLRLAAECHEGRSEHDRIQNRSDENEDDGDVDRHAFAHQAANERNHAAFTEREHDAEHAGEQNAAERVFGRQSPNVSLGNEVLHDGGQDDAHEHEGQGIQEDVHEGGKNKLRIIQKHPRLRKLSRRHDEVEEKYTNQSGDGKAPPV